MPPWLPPSTTTSATTYPLAGVMVKVSVDPSGTVTAPEGEIVPPAPAEAVISCVSAAEALTIAPMTTMASAAASAAPANASE